MKRANNAENQINVYPLCPSGAITVLTEARGESGLWRQHGGCGVKRGDIVNLTRQSAGQVRLYRNS
jgi:hypothetical protein